MLNNDIARRFVENLSLYTKYNVNVMNHEGIIIASVDSNRIGSFHETAYNMIKMQQGSVEVTDNESFLGVKEGINLLVYDEQKPVGVVGVTGNPDEVRNIAYVIKMALESMLKYEHQQEKLYTTRTAQDRLIYALFNEKNTDREKLESLATSLKINPQKIRIPIILLFGESIKIEILVNSLKGLLTSQDIVHQYNNQRILIYKDLGESRAETLLSWREEIEQWLSEIALYCNYTNAYVGTAQCRLHYYKIGLQHCLWLEDSVTANRKNIYFLDYLEKYIFSQISTSELHGIMNVYDHVFPAEEKNNILRIIGVLQHNNFNLVDASKQLYIHKNTLAFRMNKVKALLNIDPFKNNHDRLFIYCLYLYLKRKER